ncbi:MAG: hypothetical protein JG761_841 [Proteiniphilum sp.]|nr:hypothetical protein [Proteiniphilum sp.]
MSIITLTSCPVCGGNNFKKVFDAADHFSSGEVFPVCDCRECGFRFTNNFPSENTIGKYYDSPDYISHSDSDKGLINKLYHLMRRYMLTRKMNLVNRYVDGQNRKLLDIGCGTGYFLQAAKERGFTVAGIEKNDLARTHAITHFGLDVKDENSFFDIADTSFNVITLWHVLEHLEKLNESLEKLNGILTPDGTVVIALPNHHAYDARFYQTFWAAYDLPRHLWHFSPDTVEKLLNKHHLKIIAIHRMPLDAFYISMLSEKYKGSNLWVQYGRAFRVGATGFFRSLRDPGQSSSLIYIVKKK